jgi:hypothetical protein
MDILTKLADAGEEAIAKLTDAPAADRMLGAVTSMRDRMDELQKRVRGIDELEKRVAELERRLDTQAPPKAASTARSSAAKSAAKPKAKASTSKAKPTGTTGTGAKGTTAKSSTRRTGSGSPG